MTSHHPVVVIGAGPYGLAISAHLKARNLDTLTFGKPMEFWRKMPPSLCLKSSYSSITISDPQRRFTQQRYADMTNTNVSEPVPLPFLLDYAKWFQQNNVPEIDEAYVSNVTRDGSDFRVTLDDGREVTASQVVVASGVASFTNIPSYARGLPESMVTHTQDHTDFSPYRGQRTVVVGSGESAMESAALLREAGAEVEVISRGPVIWINRSLANRLTRRIFYPPSDVGPAGMSWLVHYPSVFRMLPDDARAKIDRRCVRPSVAPWLRQRVEYKLRITENTTVASATPTARGLILTLSDGSMREIDHLFLGTGYAPDVERLTFLAPDLRARVIRNNGYTVLNEWFESSVPGLYFAGAIAGYNFGPICRFIAGTGSAARQIARRAATND